MTVIPKVGNNCMPSYDIGYDDVLVGDADMLGREGNGFDCIHGTLKYSRTSLSALLLGSGRAALDLAARHARERIQFKQPLRRVPGRPPQARRHAHRDRESAFHRL